MLSGTKSSGVSGLRLVSRENGTTTGKHYMDEFCGLVYGTEGMMECPTGELKTCFYI